VRAPAIKEVEQAREDGRGAPEVLAAIKREHHHRSVVDLEKKEDPPAPGEDASFSEKMAHWVATKEGRLQKGTGAEPRNHLQRLRAFGI